MDTSHLQAERTHKAMLLADLVDKAEKSETHHMTVEELTLFDKTEEEIKQLDLTIKAVAAHEKRRGISQQLVADLNSSAGTAVTKDPPKNGNDVNTVTTFRIPARCRPVGTLKAFRGPEAELRAFRSGTWLRATLMRDPRAIQWCNNNGMAVEVYNAMSTTSNTDGGFLVPDEFSQAIIDLREQYGVFRQQAQIVPMGRDVMFIPRRLGGITIGPVGENPSAAISQSTPTFNQVQLVAKKAGGLSLMSTEISEDAAISIADWIAQEFAYGFAKFEDQCGFIGDGTSTYMGINGLMNILTEASGLAGAVTVATATHDLFSELDNTDLTTMMSKLPAYARPNAKFFCSALCMDLVFNRLKALAGGNDVMTLGERPVPSYLGYPIVISQILPAVTTTLDALPMLLFGDLRMSSTLGDRREIRVFPSEHRYMDTDQIGIRGTERFDIVNHDTGDASTAGPIVALTGSTS